MRKPTKELPQIMTIILGGILLCMVTRRKNSHLMSVDGVVVEEMAGLLVDLARAVLIAPHVEQPLVHRVRAKLGDLPQVPENTQLRVRNAHVGFVRLHVVVRDGFQLRCGCRVDEFFEDREVEVVSGPGNEFLKVDFAH